MYSRIGVNAAGVAGVATPNIWPVGVVLCWQRPAPHKNSQVFYFFPFSGTSEYRKSLSFLSTPYHTLLRWKIYKFSGKGHTPQTPPRSPPTAPRFSRLRRSTCDPPPMFQWRWRLCIVDDAIRHAVEIAEWCVVRYNAEWRQHTPCILYTTRSSQSVDSADKLSPCHTTAFTGPRGTSDGKNKLFTARRCMPAPYLLTSRVSVLLQARI